MQDDLLTSSLLSGGKAISKKRRMGPHCELKVTRRKDSLEAEVLITNARGETVAYPVDLTERDLGELDELTLWQDKPGVEKMLRALVSVGGRPSEYGIERAELNELVERGSVAVILARVPTGRAIGKSRITLTPADLGEAVGALAGNAVGRAIVLSLVRGEGPTKVICAGIPVDLHRAIAERAAADGISISQVVAQALGAHFKQS
jgi:hypothetical protein